VTRETVLARSRLLIVGNGGDGDIGAMFLSAAARSGLTTELVDARVDLRSSLLNRACFHLRGRRHPGEAALNRRILGAVARFKPTLVLVTGLLPVRASLLREIRSTGAATLNFMTDDPFNPVHRSPTALESIPAFDWYMSTKPEVDGDLRKSGARQVCRSWFAYDPTRHFPQPPPQTEVSRWSAELTFIGGGDRDRASILEPIRAWSEQQHKSFAVFGGLWERFPAYQRHYRGFAIGRHYRHALSAAKVLLCPVRRANRDGHSMRTFEAPAAGAFMLLERTPDHLELFEEDVHAVFFSDPDELRDKASFYLDREDDRRRMAAAAHARITAGGHTYSDRLTQLLQLAS
jgi:spore maturation protein CgeB